MLRRFLLISIVALTLATAGIHLALGAAMSGHSSNSGPGGQQGQFGPPSSNIQQMQGNQMPSGAPGQGMMGMPPMNGQMQNAGPGQMQGGAGGVGGLGSALPVLFILNGLGFL